MPNGTDGERKLIPEIEDLRIGDNEEIKDLYMNGKALGKTYFKGRMLQNEGKCEMALECYMTILKNNINFKDAWFNAAEIFVELGGKEKNEAYLEQAVRAYGRALEIDSKSRKSKDTWEWDPVSLSFCWCNKGVAISRLGEIENTGRYEEAVECYDKALNIWNLNKTAWFNKGVSLMELVRYDEARKCLEAALEIDPEYANAKEAMKALELTEKYIKKI